MPAKAEELASLRSSLPEAGFAALFLASGLGAGVAGLLKGHAPNALAATLFQLSGMFLIAAASFIAAAMAASGRQRGPPRKKARLDREARPLAPALEKLRARIRSLWSRLDWSGDWVGLAITLMVSLLALAALGQAWRLAAPAPSSLFTQICAGALLLATFPLLVLERRYASIPDHVLPEAPLLARLCRVPLAGVLGLCLAGGIRWLGLPFALVVERLVAVVAALVAVELCLRSLIYVFLPMPAVATRRSHADSLLAGLIQPRLPNIKAFRASVQNQFGIDLGRSWALGFIRRSTLPLLLGMALMSWLLTGVTAVGSNERAVYEAFGRPQAVMHPGVHIHWPWPFGVLRRIDYGVVREIPIGLSVAAAEARPQPSSADIEGAPPASADRLWDSEHRGEGSFLVASVKNGQQSFEAVDVDMSVVYRIGLSDVAAEKAAYQIAAPEEAIRAISGQILAGYFARYTIDDVLGQNRETFIRRFQAELQSRLVALSSGIEVMAIVVEGIHPPAEAATSYQGVQAAGIESVIKVSTAKAEAAREMKMAALVANATRDEATAAAAERINQAKGDATLFQGDRRASATGGPSFLFERRLDRLDRGLVDKPLIILDHRIKSSAAPTFDLRTSRAVAGAVADAPDDD